MHMKYSTAVKELPLAAVCMKLYYRGYQRRWWRSCSPSCTCVEWVRDRVQRWGELGSLHFGCERRFLAHPWNRRRCIQLHCSFYRQQLGRRLCYASSGIQGRHSLRSRWSDEFDTHLSTTSHKLILKPPLDHNFHQLNTRNVKTEFPTLSVHSRCVQDCISQ